MKKKIKLIICLIFVSVIGLFTLNLNKSHALSTTDNPVELRGVWVATVSNIDISKQNGTGDKAINDYKQKLLAIINRVESYGLNAIFFQIRPANDAFYESEYNPWSEYFVSRGTNPGWDMFSWLIEECHSRGIEVHAWLNPYRVTGANVVDLANMSADEIKEVKINYRNSILNTQPNINSPITTLSEAEYLEEVVAGKEGKLILNPSRDITIQHISNTIEEIITKYDVDGIHFDDYFYPSGGIEATIDNNDYLQYVDNGGTLSKEDWRRSNVDRMVETVHNIISSYNETSDHYVTFGISPAAVWAPSTEQCQDSPRGQEGGMNVGCLSYSSYNDLYADTKKWVVNEWLDYILPQNYYNFGNDYKEISLWWSKVVSTTKHVKLYIGTPLYRVTEFNDSELLKKQFEYNESVPIIQRNVSGYVLFSYRNLVSSDTLMKQAVTYLQTKFKGGALLPKYEEYESTTKTIDDVDIKIYKISNDYSVQFTQVEGIPSYVMYAISNGYDIDFNGTNTYIAKVYNDVSVGTKYIYKVTENGSKINQFVLRAFDANNNPIGYKVLDFEDAIVNSGAKITSQTTFDDSYKLHDTIHLSFKIESELDLPLTVTLLVSHNGETYYESYDLTSNSNIYEYDYETFVEGTHYFRVQAYDTDIYNTLDLDVINVGTTFTPIEPKTEEPTQSGSSCSFGISVVSTIMLFSLAFVLIRRKA